MDAELLIALERYDEAEDVLTADLRSAEASGDAAAASAALEALGTIAIRMGREPEALALMQRSLAAAGSPGPAERMPLYFEIARLLASNGDADAAVALLEPLIDQLRTENPDDLATIARYSVTLSMAEADAGRYTEAAQLLAGVLRDGGEDLDRSVAARVNYALSRLNNTTGHYELAADYARRSLALNEETGDEWAQALCHLGLGHILLTIGDTEPAADHLAASRRLYGDRLGTVDEGYLKVDEARLALQRSQPELAVALARESVLLLADAAIPGELGIAELALARGLEELGDDAGAEHAYVSSIELFRRRPGWHRERARAHRWYGKFLRRHGRDEAALHEFELAADLAPSNQ
jgi:tetratricopeptide (TPR) repeat protein